MRVILCLFLLGPWCGLSAEDAKDLPERPLANDPGVLMAAGDRLALKKDYAGAVLSYKRAYKWIVEDLRGLDFKHDVQAGILDRQALRVRLLAIFNEEMPEEKCYFLERALWILGMLPQDFDIHGMFVDLYQEQVAGFYDPKTKELFLIKEDDTEPVGMMNFLLGKQSSFDPQMQKMVLAHEMTHALADQQFNLGGMIKSVRHDDDMALALMALVEGEATLLMIMETMRLQGEPPETALMLSPGYMDRMFSFLGPLIPIVSGASLRNAPEILKKSMVFPYFKGMVLALHIIGGKNWESVNRAFADPPVSTEQVMHPEKYISPERDVPVVITLSDFEDILGEDWRKLGNNVLGEFQISVLLDGFDEETAAHGWDGDTYIAYEHTDGACGLMWFSTWDRTQDALEFADAFQAYAKARLDHMDAIHVRQKGVDVAVVMGFADDLGEKILLRLFESHKTPKRLVRPADKKTGP